MRSAIKALAGLALGLMGYTAVPATYIVPTQVPMTYTNPSAPVAPSPAALVGFTTLTFSSPSFSATNVDTTDACNPSQTSHVPCTKQWYLYHNSGANPAAGNGAGGSCLPNITFNSGVLVLLGCTTGPNGEITTAVPLNNGADWAGTGFGCGAYFEWTAVMSDSIASGNNACTSSASTCSGGWQALWSQPIEFSYTYASGSAYTWPGQGATYRLSLEDDAFELTQTGSNPYGSALHMLYGISGSTCTGTNCQLSSSITRGVTSGYVSSNSYTYGELWVPATASTKGYVKYFRGTPSVYGSEAQQSSITQSWDQFISQAPTSMPAGALGAGNAFATSCSALNGSGNSGNCVGVRTGAGQGVGNPTWVYGVHDLLHYAPIMGTGTGNVINGGSNAPPVLNISNFAVWQGTGACNITN